jgi:hypothetical protein
MKEECFDCLDKKYVDRYQIKPYSIGFVVSSEFAKEWHRKIYGKVCSNGKLFYRNYHREIKKGFSLIDIYKQKRNNALNGTVFFNNI